METAKLYTVCAFATGLAITLFLAAYLTPSQWWRRANARALLIMVVGAWGFGSLILYAAQGTRPVAAGTLDGATNHPPAAASATTSGPASLPPELIAGRAFQVHRDLNVRAASGVSAARLTTVAAGATVTPTGVREGDWWQVTTSANGREQTGWVSSLWLRRGGE
ncbi:SH3 domain-containing protein [Duganella sp. CF517]|uniref:SH3 domain-containing protein n=1 Tax=Duganella sp. CF517 TaxID=1881038 RepID=UPI0008BC0B23|nr:SH3 domain-containing protein [Duganella sp. CF517]SEO07899.1 SH3 domain-containing protein [Duganella sp. CF517]